MATDLDRKCLALELGFQESSSWTYIRQNGSNIYRKTLAEKFGLPENATWEQVGEKVSAEKTKR
jgi:hypothetical protein